MMSHFSLGCPSFVEHFDPNGLLMTMLLTFGTEILTTRNFSDPLLVRRSFSKIANNQEIISVK